MTPSPQGADVLVLGAGAAGLMAAIQAARAGADTILLEKNERPGLKILISGGGRCNLTTTRRGHDLEQQYGTRRGRWLRHALRSFPPEALCAFVEEQGVELGEEDLEKIFPTSGRAQDVLDALMRHLASSGARLVRGAPMTEVTREGEVFVVTTPQGQFSASALVLATGGLSYPRTGATGDGYPVASAFGHTIVHPVPALAPLALDVPWIHELAGLVVDASLEIRPDGGRGASTVQRRRPTLFTHRGLSGPGPMDVSGFVEEVGGGCELRVDWSPDTTAEQLDADLVAAARSHGRRSVQHALPSSVPERLRQHLCAEAGADGDLAGLRKDVRRQLVELVKATRIPVERSLGFKAAEVTRGGVALDEVDARTMQSKCCPGLYLCGEILDVDGPIGGFNFQAAFATGRIAGLSAAARTRG
jgi:predicted Rossmann fold flavoprotein